MFESVKQTDRSDGMMYAASLFVSLLAHAVIICLVIVIPLVFFSSLQAEELLTFLYAPPAPPPPPPAPAPPASHADKVRNYRVDVDLPPDHIPAGVFPVPPDESSPIEIDVGRIAALAGSGRTAGAGGGLPPGVVTLPPIQAPPEPRRPSTPPPPVRVANLETSRLIHKVSPVYPETARRAHVSGDVILEAVIDEEGNVSAVKVLSGHVLLVDAAVQAVKQWKYSPTILTGEPVPIIATVTVMFRLN